MGLAQKIFLCLCFSAALVSAAQFGTVRIDLLPAPTSRLSSEDYHFFTFELQNLGPQPAYIFLRLNARNYYYYHHSASLSLQVRKSVLLAPGGIRTLTLTPPALHHDIFSSDTLTSDYQLAVFVDGKSYTYNLQLHGRHQSSIGPEYTALLSNSLLESAFNEILSVSTYYDQMQVLQASESFRHWPRREQFYFGKSIIFCSSEDEFPDDLRQLLREWVFAGGTLITCLPPDQSWSEKYPYLSDGWDFQPYGWGAEVICQPFNQEQLDKINEFHKQDPLSDFNKFSGRVTTVMAPNPVWESLDRSVFAALQNHPFRAGKMLQQQQQYLSLPVPEIKTRALLFIMLLFVIVIGPVNYYFFHRRKQKLWLLLSTPLLSTLFCLLVVVFITFGEGWSATAESVGITILDQNSNLATTKALCGIYSSINIKDPLRFSDQDCVVFNNIEKYRMLDEPGQVFEASLVRSRIPVYYAVSRTEDRQERLNFRDVPEGLEVINGLGGQLEQLAVRCSENLIYISITPIVPGEKTILTRKIQLEGVNTAFSAQEFAAAAATILRSPVSADSLKLLFDHLPVGYYAAITAEPLFFTTGNNIRPYSHRQLILGF